MFGAGRSMQVWRETFNTFIARSKIKSFLDGTIWRTAIDVWFDVIRTLFVFTVSLPMLG
jgi:hypothetical protein